ncbi:MAG TPA: arginine repressor [Terriglobales bacterium]|nr:arginine repressor [Terriglobales bacterium]
MNIYSQVFIFIHMAKAGRQKAILELVQESPIASQEELQRALGRRGIKVGQATLSRDLHELELVKTAEGYALPSGGTASEAALPSASRLVREFVLDVRPAQNLVVVKTAVGSAQPVAAALDGENWPEVVGTIAGDDAILIVAENNKRAARLVQRIRELLA